MQIEPEETFISATVSLLAEGVAVVLFLAMCAVYAALVCGA